MPQLFVDYAWCAAVVALQVVLDLIGNRLIALSGQHVEHCLRTNDLRSRSDQRRITKVTPYEGNLGKDLVDAMQSPLLFQLVGQVRHHATGDLVHLNPSVYAGEL